MEGINKAVYKPNYEDVCCNCGQVPTVEIYENGKLVVATDMCGPCTWGEAETIDPDNW